MEKNSKQNIYSVHHMNGVPRVMHVGAGVPASPFTMKKWPQKQEVE